MIEGKKKGKGKNKHLKEEERIDIRAIQVPSRRHLTQREWGGAGLKEILPHIWHKGKKEEERVADHFDGVKKKKD